ncbi:lon protease [Nanoarchaeota archaeon]
MEDNRIISIKDLYNIFTFKTTEEIKVPEKIYEQIIGQDEALDIIKKAAKQRRHVLLIGDPGTGKSMLARALAEMLSEDKESVRNLEDIVVFPNPNDEYNPIVKTFPAGMGKKIVEEMRKRLVEQAKMFRYFYILLLLISSLTPLYFYYVKNYIMAGATFIGFMILIAGLSFSMQFVQRQILKNLPKVIVDNSDKQSVPFVDATGAFEGMLFGDVLHDPYQSFSSISVAFFENPTKNFRKLMKMSDFVDYILFTHKDRLFIDNINDSIYYAVNLENEDWYTYTLENGKIKKVKIISVNKRVGEFNVIPVEKDDHFIALTPEHEIYTNKGLIKAEEYNNEKLFIYDLDLLTEEDIVKTYGEKELEKYNLYLIWKEFKEKNLNIGYKKAAKILNIPESKTKWWEKGMKPISFHVIKELKKLNLLPLKLSDNRLPTIARIYGYILGDGNIDKNLNTLSIISSNLEALNRILEDMKKVFGEFTYEIRENTTSYGKSYILRTTERRIIRFFVALGYTVGKKIDKEIKVPEFVLLRKDTIIEFLRGLFDSDGSVYSFGNKSNLRGTLCYSIASINDNKLTENRKKFLEEIKLLLELLDIKMNEINQELYDNGNKVEFRLLISHKPDNMIKFYELLRPIYNTNKAEILIKGINYAVNHPERTKKFHVKNIDPKVREVYNITTETGNLIVNGILVKNSGGLETPAHQRVIAGAIHKAHKGVLFIDEIGTLRPEVQIELLTVLQDKKYPIFGRSERSAGAMVRTTPAPADFVLVAAGNLETLDKLHPAFRSRIKGYGYEVFMKSEIPFTEEIAKKFAQFVAQEVNKSGNIPHFTKEAVIEIIREAQRRSGRKNYLTLRLRDLGGLVRLAGDIAKYKGKEYVDKEDVLEAKEKALSIEEQLSKYYIERRKQYQIVKTSGYEIGRVNGLAVIGSRLYYSGLVLPVEAEVVPGKGTGKVIATGNLGKIAKEAIVNVSTVIKKKFKEDLKKYDVHVQFLQTYEGVEGDSASITVATAIISALKNWPVRQDLAMTGSLSIRGEVLPIGGVIAKVEAAIESGLKEVLVPESNYDDIPEDLFDKIKITPVKTIDEVIDIAMEKDI